MNSTFVLVMNYSEDLWAKDGKIHPYITEVRPDKCLASSLIRNKVIKPHTFVTYDPKSAYSDVNEHGDDIYLIKVVPVDNPQAEASAVSICMLDLTKRQQKNLNNHYKVPTAAFKKEEVAIHVERPIRDLSVAEVIDEIAEDGY